MTSARRIVLRRVVARVCDLALVTAGPLLAYLALSAQDTTSDAEVWGAVLLWVAFHLLWLGVAWPIYEAVSYRSGGTLGKRLLGLRSISVVGTRPPWSTVLLRGVLMSWPFLAVAPMAIPAALYAAWLGWDAVRRPDGRTWVDRACGSVVVPVGSAAEVRHGG